MRGVWSVRTRRQRIENIWYRKNRWFEGLESNLAMPKMATAAKIRILNRSLGGSFENLAWGRQAVDRDQEFYAPESLRKNACDAADWPGYHCLRSCGSGFQFWSAKIFYKLFITTYRHTHTGVLSKGQKVIIIRHIILIWSDLTKIRNL